MLGRTQTILDRGQRHGALCYPSLSLLIFLLVNSVDSGQICDVKTSTLLVHITSFAHSGRVSHLSETFLTRDAVFDSDH